MKLSKLLRLAAVALVAVPGLAEAQFGPSARAAGFAGAYTTLARGYEAVFWNPANLGLDDNPFFSIGLPNVSLTNGFLGTDLMELETVVTGEGFDAMTPEGRQAVLATIPTTGLELRTNADVPLVGLSIGPVALSLSTTMLANANMSREMVGLLWSASAGEELGLSQLSNFQVGNTAFRTASYSTAQAATGIGIGPLSIGVGGRFVLGHGLYKARMLEPRIDITDPANPQFGLPMLMVGTPSGMGYGVDVGVALEPIPGLTLGASVQNVYQQMTWGDSIEIRQGELGMEDFAGMDVPSIMAKFEPQPFDPASAPLAAYDLLEGFYDEQYFPRVIRLGASYEILWTRVGVTYSQTHGSTDTLVVNADGTPGQRMGALHSGWPQYLAFGVEQEVPVFNFFAIRAGYATSFVGASSINGGVSLNLGPLHITAAAARSLGATTAADLTHAEELLASSRYADRLVAGSGYSAMLGVDIVSW